MYRRLSEEVRAAGLAAGGADSPPVTEEDLADLPETVRRYLRAMGVLNRPRDWSFMAHLTGRFRLKGQGYPFDGDHVIFTRGSAIWKLPEGPLNYLDFRMSAGGVRYNLEPEDIVRASW